MKLAAMLLICLPVMCVGPLRIRRQRRRAWVLRQFSAYFDSLARSAAGFRGDLAALMRRAAAGTDGAFLFPAALAGAAQAQGNPGAIWRETLCACSEWNRLSEVEHTLLTNFGAAFSCVSLGEFESLCRKTAQQCAGFAEETDVQNRKNEKLWLTLPSLLAALLFVILI